MFKEKDLCCLGVLTLATNFQTVQCARVRWLKLIEFSCFKVEKIPLITQHPTDSIDSSFDNNNR